MIQLTRPLASGAVALLAAGAVAGCGSSSSSASKSTPAAAVTASSSASAAASPSAAGTSSAPAFVLSSFKTPQDGTLLTGTGHRSLYILTKDEKTAASHAKLSACYGGCAAVWPPVLASRIPGVAGLAVRSLVGLTTRRDGSRQVTYNGRPLYYYAADAKAGQSTGNHLKDSFGLWIGVLPNGKLAPDGAQ